jgi:large-conductance mechanosensitive channel
MLDTKDLIILTAAFYLGSVVSKFFSALSEGIIAPILAPAASAGKGITGAQVVVGGVTLKVGEVVSALVNLLVSFVIVVFAIGFLRTYFLSKIGAGKGAGMGYATQ